MEKRSFSRRLVVLVVAVSLLFSVKAGAADWWKPTSEVDRGKVWHYRAPIMVTAPGKLDYTDYPIEVEVDFNACLEKVGSSSETLDLPNSLRLVSADGKEIPCQYDDTIYKGKEDDAGNGKGTVVFILDNLKSGTFQKYFLYFDTIEAGGIKRKPEYPIIKAMKGDGSGHIDTGKIKVSLNFGGVGNKPRAGIRGLSINSPEGDIKIPIYHYGVDSLRFSTPFEVAYTKGPVFARYRLTNTMKVKVDNEEKTKTVKATFTFFNNSSIWYRDDWEGVCTNYMGRGFFTTVQDNTMSEPQKIADIIGTEEKKHRSLESSGRYGVATSSDGYSFATCLGKRGMQKVEPHFKSNLSWGIRWRRHLVLPTTCTVGTEGRTKHNLAKGGIEIALLLDEPPTLMFNPNQAEKKK
jgi:hypothetical protein